MKKLIIVMVAISVIFATITAGLNQYSNFNICMHTQSIVRTMTSSTVTGTVHNHTPNNHNLQESAVTIEKIHKLESPADYMDGLTAYSRRTIYVGEAEYCRFPIKIMI